MGNFFYLVTIKFSQRHIQAICSNPGMKYPTVVIEFTTCFNTKISPFYTEHGCTVLSDESHNKQWLFSYIALLG